MKFVLSFVGVFAIALAVLFCGQKPESVNEDYMRIHITANSTSSQDENVKYMVKDAVTNFLIPILSEAETKSEAEIVVSQNLQKIEEIANSVIKSNSLNYSSKVCIDFEQMPARAYDNLVLDEGVYQSLNIVLGDGKGDNWWCVVFPAVCFLNSNNFQNLEYISKIWDIINGVTTN